MPEDTVNVGTGGGEGGVEDGLRPIGEQGAQLKRRIEEAKPGDEKGMFDPGASMLGTDNEAGSAPDPDGMAEARKAPPP